MAPRGGGNHVADTEGGRGAFRVRTRHAAHHRACAYPAAKSVAGMMKAASRSGRDRLSSCQSESGWPLIAPSDEARFFLLMPSVGPRREPYRTNQDKRVANQQVGSATHQRLRQLLVSRSNHEQEGELPHRVRYVEPTTTQNLLTHSPKY